MATRTTTTGDALELAARLDGAALFLGALTETPWFADQQQALAELGDAVATARDDVQARHGLRENEVEEREEALMCELGLLGKSGCAIDPGFGRDIAHLDEQLHQLAERVIGVQWSHGERCWLSLDTDRRYD